MLLVFLLSKPDVLASNISRCDISPEYRTTARQRQKNAQRRPGGALFDRVGDNADCG